MKWRARDRVAQAVLVVGTVAAVGIVVIRIRAALQPLRIDGVGAISVGVAEALVESFFFVIVPVGINIGLRGVARKRGQLATTLRRIHLWTTLCALPWMMVTTAWLSRVAALNIEAFSRASATTGVVSAVFLGLQAFFASCALALAIGQSASSPPSGE